MKGTRSNPPALPLLLAVVHSLSYPVAAQTPPLDDYRRHAFTREGDAANGEKLFHGEKLLCSQCHSTDGSASKAGPDLFAAGDAFGRRDLVEAVLQPSASIAPGYGTVVVETEDGGFQGVLKGSTEELLQLMGPDGKLVSVPTSGIEKQSGVSASMMPEGLHANVSIREFGDLIEYLASLKQDESTLASHHGMPAEIPLVAKPVEVRPFLTQSFTLPRSGQESGLSSFRQIPGSDATYLVLHQKGMIWKVVKTAGGEDRSLFLNLTDVVFSERGPNGLLDVSFHPQFRDNRKYYLFYQVFEDGKVVSKIVEREMDAGFGSDSGRSPRLILEIASVAEDHSGGCLQFGADGFLYIVMGDTGPHNDPGGHAQNMELLLGKLMRIDVDREEAGKPYHVPNDNPFVGWPNVRPEIWASGFRNPWRFSFDRLTGDLWLADVGQDRVEEVNIVVRGGNYGWNVYEAFETFSNQYRKEGEPYAKPVFAYRRKYGNSVTGGHVYRGDEGSPFYGVYICGDYTSKRIFGVVAENGILKSARQIGLAPERIASFAEDEAGNFYVVGYEGRVYRIDFSKGEWD